jgi:hypothetical protein
MDSDDARERPVTPTRCLWCKHTVHGDDAHTLGTDERLCQQCLEDLREFKRTRFVDILVASSLEATTRTALLEDWHDIRDRIAEIHGGDTTLTPLPARTSNADDYSLHTDGSESGTGD